MASGQLVKGGENGGSRRLGESNVYSRKSSKGSKISRNSDGSAFDIAPDDTLSLRRGKVGVMGDNGEEKGFLRPESRVTINLSSKKKGEVRELRRKLLSELNLVKSLMRKIEEQKNGTGGGLKRVNSDMWSRSSNELNVPILENNQGGGENVEKEKRISKTNKICKNSGSLHAKEKFPTAGSNRKSKANALKGGATEEEDGFVPNKFSKQAFKSCSALLERLMKHKHGWVFNTPVDSVALGLHDYLDIIKHPMDLGTVKARLTDNYYKSPREFADDVRLTFQNAMTYNPQGQDVYLMAEQLLKIFDDKWGTIETNYLQELKVGAEHVDGPPNPTTKKIARPPRPHPEKKKAVERPQSMLGTNDAKPKVTSLAPPSRTSNPKKPNTMDQSKREMTFEEKQKLSLSLQNLPSEKLENVVEIIKKKNPSLCQQDDEIEVDIDIVDTETLWELDRFVTDYNKSSNKNKRKAEHSNPAKSETEKNVEEKNPPHMLEGTADQEETEEKLMSSIPAEVKKRDDNVGRSSSASTSSINSRSSSSGSDSGSSI